MKHGEYENDKFSMNRTPLKTNECPVKRDSFNRKYKKWSTRHRSDQPMVAPGGVFGLPVEKSLTAYDSKWRWSFWMFFFLFSPF